jgi:hypothetical protein
MAHLRKSEDREHAKKQLQDRISSFLSDFSVQLREVAEALPAIFEASCYISFVRYYSSDESIELRCENLIDGHFRFRTTTNSFPWRYSFFTALRRCQDDQKDPLFEIRHNQQVAGAWTEKVKAGSTPPLFAVDVAVLEIGALPHLPFGQTTGPKWVQNSQLITFGEAKMLTAYPMLIAQFFGVVHEVAPACVGRTRRRRGVAIFVRPTHPHPPPVLFLAGTVSKGAGPCIDSLYRRKCEFRVVANVIDSDWSKVLNQFCDPSGWKAVKS